MPILENGVLTDQNENGLCKSAGYYGCVRAFHTNPILSRAGDPARIIEIGFGTDIAIQGTSGEQLLPRPRRIQGDAEGTSMRHTTDILVKTSVLVLALLALVPVVAAQLPRGKKQVPRAKVDLGKGMSPITTSLMQVAANSAFFLQLSDQIGLSGEQKKKLEEFYFEAQKFSILRQADLEVADAELRRLLSNDRVDLMAVGQKVKEIQELQTEETIKGIDATLRAINVLTHEQHIKVLLLMRAPSANEFAPAPVSVKEVASPYPL